MIPFPYQLGQSGIKTPDGDPFYASRILGLHCDGLNASTTFTDNSPTPKVVTTAGNVQISTAQSKFGGTSALFDGSGDFLSCPDTTDFDFGTGSFTIEAFVRPTLALDQNIMSKRISGANGWALEARSTGAVWLRSNIGGTYNDQRIATAAGILTANTWAHVALVRNGSSWVIYVNGVSRATLTEAGTLDNQATLFRVGSSAAAGENFMNGYIDELLVYKGIAKYTAAFTPPVAPFANFR